MRECRYKYEMVGVVVGNAVRRFMRDECFTLASSISFYFLLSIIPFTALTIIVFNLVIKGLAFIFNVQVELGDLLIDNITELIPFVSPQWLTTYVIHPEATASFTLIGLLFLPVISSLIFNILERAYQRIFRRKSRLRLVRKMIYPLLVLVIILFLFILNFGANIVSSTLTGLIDKTPLTVVFFVGPGTLLLQLITPVVFVLSFFGTTALFLNTPIRFTNKLLAGLVFYLLWLGAKLLFGLYIAGVSNVTNIYGPLSSVVIVLLWVYYSAAALLFSVEILYQLHLNDNLADPR